MTTQCIDFQALEVAKHGYSLANILELECLIDGSIRVMVPAWEEIGARYTCPICGEMRPCGDPHCRAFTRHVLPYFERVGPAVAWGRTFGGSSNHPAKHERNMSRVGNDFCVLRMRKKRSHG